MKSYHRHTLQAYRHSFFPALFLCIGQLILWFIFVSIAIYAYRKISYYALLVCIPALLALFVFRFYIINKLLHLLDPLAPRCKSFASLLLSASYRLLTGVLWFSRPSKRALSAAFLKSFSPISFPISDLIFPFSQDKNISIKEEKTDFI